MRIALALVALFVEALHGCGAQPSEHSFCPNRAAFTLALSAEPGPVPRQTTLAVNYGGGTDEYRVLSPPDSSDVLFCRLEERDDAEEGINRVLCEVWTQSTISVRVTSDGYAVLEQELSVERGEDDCLRTRAVALTLRRPAPGR